LSKLVSIFDSEAVEQLRKETRLDPEHIRALRNAIFKKFEADDVAIARFPERERIVCHALELFRRCDSEVDGASKLLLKTDAGMLIESVILRIATGRSTLCVSSQVGCAAACDFCATGKMGIAQNLSSAEILDQVVQTGQILAAEGRRLHNIVFMGMGEPLHNEENLFETLDALTSPKMFNRSPGSILVSTVGVPEGMLRCTERFPKVNLALSLHSVNPEVRRELIPLAKKHSLDELQETLRELNRQQEIPVMIEYLMLAEKNDSADDASQLVEWLRGLDVHVNLIPYNEIEDAPHLTGTEDEKIRRFASTLKDAGLTTTVRYSLGSDIAAACGQLVRKENRQTAMASDGELPHL
jgi:23S rRNA (adenine2503-C2)-methyltransferase